MKRQVEEYCDRKLARFEAVLERTTETVRNGRQKLIGMSEVSGAKKGEWTDGNGWNDADIDLSNEAGPIDGEVRS